MPTCFVMQPFDAADFDKRFDEIYKPAIIEAGFEPYRVDRDPSAAIPIDNIEIGIRTAAACFVDVTLDNPNVWFELGYAICAKKPLCIVCGEERQKFPFDIQHRMVIRYKRSSISDFTALKSKIVDRMRALETQNETIESIIKAPPLGQIGELDIMQFSALTIIYENHDLDDTPVSVRNVTNEMERAGYTKIAAKIALAKLQKSGLISIEMTSHFDSMESFMACAVTSEGNEYILQNENNLKLRST